MSNPDLHALAVSEPKRGGVMLAQGRIFYGWIMLSAIILMSFSSAGARFSFGVFVAPWHENFGWRLVELSGAASLNLLVAGLLRPVAGFVADRFGSRITATLGLSIAGLALLLTSMVTELWQFYITYGIVLAMGRR
jgi:sugar phosphate permease